MDIKKTNKNLIVKDLKALGVSEGDHLGIGLSFKSIGPVEGGPETLIDAFIESVGPNGTIMMPSYTRFFPLSKIQSGKVNYIFDYKTTEGITGIIPELLRKRKESIRSRHPTNSVTAIGKAAEYLTKEHNENAMAYMPYSKLTDINGKILCIGIGDRLVGIRHEAQFLAGLLDIIPYKIGVQYKDANDNIRLFIRKDKGGCTTRLPEFTSILKKAGMVKEGKIGAAHSLLIPAHNILDVMIDMLKKNPTLNLCRDALCLWCREIERRLNLYSKIEDPAYFQKYRFVRNTLALINWFQIRK
jgi:aminoglycoside 3-N-acetyltransferase